MSLEFIGALVVMGGGLGLVFNILDGRMQRHKRFVKHLREVAQRRELDESNEIDERIAALEESLAEAHAAIRHIMVQGDEG